MKIAIIDYGAGNIRSLAFALERLGETDLEITNSGDKILAAERVIFPGVGHASYAMLQLKKYGLDTLIPKLRQPFLGICLGMQLMCNQTEEGNVNGLGIFDTSVIKFKPLLKVPHMGWNKVMWYKNPFNEVIPSMEWYYFVHGYYAETGVQTVGLTEYINDFSAVMRQDNFIGCQFHPEKSGAGGSVFLEHFLFDEEMFSKKGETMA
ncbi:MAG: imidazole glycerol phosphate synthase subunit HisH [Bacteroidetes bacterium HGW-Bacteroidetes-1]|jgi:glutamine amidotransferase|nr:MAG: imidazole glycerol phosphate synthase subunit HisH [Bacteroidetes bacterium HGW-Bacteroidetes-1]